MARSPLFICFCATLLIAGCATSPKKGDPLLHAPARPAEPTSAQRGSEAKLPDGEFTVLVDSQPAGGTVVVNGIPVGKAPQRIILPGTTRGFFREEVSLRVRFLAVDTGHVSQTVEELMTPLDRIPASVLFTPAGANRVMR